MAAIAFSPTPPPPPAAFVSSHANASPSSFASPPCRPRSCRCSCMMHLSLSPASLPRAKESLPPPPLPRSCASPPSVHGRRSSLMHDARPSNSSRGAQSKIIRTTRAVKMETPEVEEKEENSSSALDLAAGHGDDVREPETRKRPEELLLRVDTVAEREMKQAKDGLRGMRRTKLVCTIGPSSCSSEQLEAMAEAGMNIARLNMCHGTKDWHSTVIGRIRKLNEEKGFSVAVMMDTEGSEIHMGDLGGSSEGVKTEDGDVWIFTVRESDRSASHNTIQVNYAGFAEDVMVRDELVVDGGMVRFEVVDKVGPDVHCRCTDPGLLLPRANLTFWRDGHLLREGSAMLPTLSSKDWIDIDFGIHQGVDFIAVSFVKAADVIMDLKSYVSARSPKRKISIIAKIESYESHECLEDIIVVSDGVMVGRGDLSAQIPIEQVPSVQEKVVYLCRQLNKPVMVASQLLESMMEYPTPTRAEVADVSEMVQQQVDALMLSGESAMGRFPVKSLSVLRIVSLRMEEKCRVEKVHEVINLQQLAASVPDKISEEICNAAAVMANELNADAIFVYTKQGHMATLLSRNRAQCPIFAFTDSEDVRILLNLLWGVIPFGLSITQDMEHNLEVTFSLLKARDIIKCGDLIIVVSDLAPSSEAKMVQSIQVRRIT